MVALNENAISRLATVASIDATAIAVTSLYTVPASKTFIPDHIVIRVTSFTSGGKGVEAIASFGGNSATFDDFLNTITYTVAAADVWIRDSVEDSATVTQAAGDVFSISVETASDASVEVWAVEVFGYLV